MSDLTTVTAGELRSYLATQPADAIVALAGVPDAPLIGWTDASRTTSSAGEPVVLLAFDTSLNASAKQLADVRAIAQRAWEYGSPALYEDDVTDLFRALGDDLGDAG